MKFGTLLSSREKDYFYIMHLSYNGDKREELWDYAKKNNLIGLDAPRIVKGDWVKVRETARKSLRKGWIRQFDTFCSRMQKGDLVMVLSGMDSVLGVAEIAESRHRYDRSLSDSEAFFDHIRQINWIRRREYRNRLMLSRPLYGFSHTLSIVTRNSPRWPILTDIDI